MLEGVASRSLRLPFRQVVALGFLGLVSPDDELAIRVDLEPGHAKPTSRSGVERAKDIALAQPSDRSALKQLPELGFKVAQGGSDLTVRLIP